MYGGRLKYKIISTEDGTFTVFNKEYNEAMHSISGAYEEALLKHVYPSRILESDKDSLNVLDIGFGLGYNILALIVEVLKKIPDTLINIVSFEKDKSYLPLMDFINFNDERDEFYKIIKSAFINHKYTSEKISIDVMFGDARHSIASMDGIQFDSVFHDPFSPSKNPELWSVEFFKEIYRLIDKDGILTTYSSAPQIRMGLLKAGFIIGRGPSVGRKREGTIAAKSNIFQSLNIDEIISLEENAKSVPYHDFTLHDLRINILKRRINETAITRTGRNQNLY